MITPRYGWREGLYCIYEGEDQTEHGQQNRTEHQEGRERVREEEKREGDKEDKENQEQSENGRII